LNLLLSVSPPSMSLTNWVTPYSDAVNKGFKDDWYTAPDGRGEVVGRKSGFIAPSAVCLVSAQNDIGSNRPLHFEVLPYAFFEKLPRVGFAAVVQALEDLPCHRPKHRHHGGIEMAASVAVQNRHAGFK